MNRVSKKLDLRKLAISKVNELIYQNKNEFDIESILKENDKSILQNVALRYNFVPLKNTALQKAKRQRRLLIFKVELNYNTMQHFRFVTIFYIAIFFLCLM